MATRTASEIYTSLTAEGFSPTQATTLTAIALAESAGNDTVLGDVNLETSTWGPSYGLYQVRTLKADTGRGTDRDITYLSASDANQAKAAFDISHGGIDFTPWTTYTSGAYQQYLGQAQAAAAGKSITTTGNNSGPFPTFGPSWLPWNWPSDAANAATNSIASDIRTIVVEGLFVILGVGLVGLGLARSVAPQLKRTAHAAAKVGEVAVL